MILFFRIVLVTILGMFRRRIDPLEPSTLRLTVLPTDCDLYVHLNNGRYLSLMDLGRLDMGLRSGLGSIIRRRRWFPVAGAVTIRFRRSIEIFERFDLETSVVGWDDKWFWVLQRFLVRGEVRAEALVKAVFLEGRDTIAPVTVFAAGGLEVEPRKLPEWIAHWLSAEEFMKTREGEGVV